MILHPNAVMLLRIGACTATFVSLFTFVYVIAFMSTRSTMPANASSFPIGRWMGTGVAPRRSRIYWTAASKSAPPDCATSTDVTLPVSSMSIVRMTSVGPRSASDAGGTASTKRRNRGGFDSAGAGAALVSASG